MLNKNILMLNLFTKYRWLGSYFDNNFLSLLKNDEYFEVFLQKQLHACRKENSQFIGVLMAEP